MNSWPGVIAAYEDYLPVTPKTPRLTLLEGNTPLIPAPYFSRQTGLEVYLKYEGANPTGSFKDRGMVLAVARAMEDGAQAIMCASTGNTSASAAAYAAHCGLKCTVLIPAGNVALGKLAQALIYGARVVSIAGNFDAALAMVREITSSYPITLVNSLNPFRLEGQKTAAFEVCDALGRSPDFVTIPVGNAGNISAYWQGFKEYHQRGKINSRPRMLGFQAEGANPIVRGCPIPNPETVATAIRIGNPASWQKAVAAAAESGGLISDVSDAEILAAQKELAAREGVFTEPASAASVAGLLKQARAGLFPPGATVVCVLTGNGLKDPDTALSQVEKPQTVAADKEAIVALALS
ncbi:MAG: threonine synthase [Clostridia bacterium]|nr:MAG: threonine synthase [Clostridia bacterium]